MNIVDGLYGYEIVLGALGTLLFVVLIPVLSRPSPWATCRAT